MLISKGENTLVQNNFPKFTKNKIFVSEDNFFYWTKNPSRWGAEEKNKISHI